jgi:hypothetical protein
MKQWLLSGSGILVLKLQKQHHQDTETMSVKRRKRKALSIAKQCQERAVQAVFVLERAADVGLIVATECPRSQLNP